MRLLVALVAGTVLLGGCGGGQATTESTVSDDAMEIREELAQLFSQGIAGDASCADLFSYRNALDVDTSIFFDRKLREVGCFSSTSERTDNPAPGQRADSATAGSSQSATTSKPPVTDEFMQFLRARLRGTSYSIESLTTPFGKAQVQTYTWAAQSICKDLRAGKDERDMRVVIAREERLGDPALDRDIPAYVDAIFEAAKTYICP